MNETLGAPPAPWRLARALATVATVAAVATLGACGGADAPATPGPAAPPPPPPPPATTPVPPPPGAGALTYYFSNCEAGAAATCVPGDNARAGTSPDAPRRDLTGLDVNALPAGSQLLFARGGKWANFSLFVYNTQATPSQPLVFGSYTPASGATARPWLVAPYEQTAFTFGGAPATGDPQRNIERDGGYTVRGLRLQGTGRTEASVIRPDSGIFIINRARDVLLEDLEILDFGLGVYTTNETVGSPLDDSNLGIVNLTLRRSLIARNTRMGLLGDAENYTIEGNTFTGNNLAPYPASAFNHAIYLGGHGRNGIVRDNQFINNSAEGGTCTGGNLTVHGQWNGLLIEGNTLSQVRAQGSCYGISVTPGYDSAEYFRGLVVRHNTVVNLGGCAICVGVAVNPLIEGNLMINRNDSWMSGVVLAANVGSPGAGGDDIDNGATVRNNTLCSTYLAAGSELVATRNAGAVTLSGNVLRTGAEASTGPCAP